MSGYKYYDTEYYPHARERGPNGSPVYKRVKQGDIIKIYGAFGFPWVQHHEMVTEKKNGVWHSIGVTADGLGIIRCIERPLYEAVRCRYTEIDDGPTVDNTLEHRIERVKNGRQYDGKPVKYWLTGPTKPGKDNKYVNCQSWVNGIAQLLRPTEGKSTQTCVLM